MRLRRSTYAKAPVNVLNGKLANPTQGMVEVDGTAITLPMPIAATAGSSVSLATRPESIRLKGADACDTRVPAEIGEVSFLGSVIRIRARMLGAEVEFDMFNQPDMPPPLPGSRVIVGFNSRDLMLLDS